MNDVLVNVVESFNLLPQWLQAIVVLVSGLVTTMTAFTMATPTQVDDKYLPVVTKPLNFVLRIANLLAGNFAKNKNADDTPKQDLQ